MELLEDGGLEISHFLMGADFGGILLKEGKTTQETKPSRYGMEVESALGVAVDVEERS